MTWTIGRYPRDKIPELVGTLHLASGVTEAPIESASAVLHFSVPNTTVSGLAVKDLQLSNERYKFFKVRVGGAVVGAWRSTTAPVAPVLTATPTPFPAGGEDLSPHWALPGAHVSCVLVEKVHPPA